MVGIGICCLLHIGFIDAVVKDTLCDYFPELNNLFCVLCNMTVVTLW